jgi:hypothetical protein
MAVKSLKRSSVKSTQKTNAINAGYSFQDFELIESVFVASPTASVTFNNLNQYATEYRHLQVRITGRTTNSAQQPVNVQFNSDSGFNYSIHRLTGTGSSVVSVASPNQPNLYAALIPGSSATASAFGASVFDILDFYNPAKNKTTRAMAGQPSQPEFSLYAGAWYNTNPINSIRFFVDAASFIAASRFSLYGIR